MKKFVSILLTLGFGLFLADAGVSLLDDTLILFIGTNPLSYIRAIISLFSFIAVVVIYVLMGITPMVPKRFFLPMTLFGPVVLLGSVPLFIYHFDWLPQIAWLISLGKALLSLGLLAWLQGGWRIRWPLVREEQLGDKGFGWLNLAGFILANLFVLLPGAIVYLAWCGALAVDHFSGGFLALHSDRLAVWARQYVREDGKTVHLIPMMHIGEPGFYQEISKSIPTNSIVLLEGVSDEKKLLKHKLSYQRAAATLGLAEQMEEFAPDHARSRRADVDVGQFSAKSIEFLNVAMLLHSQGPTPEVIGELLRNSQDPAFSKQLWDDLLTRRNEHVLKEVQTELLESETIVLPWGAAHMRGIAEGIQKSGFKPVGAQEYTILHYRTIWNGLRSR